MARRAQVRKQLEESGGADAFADAAAFASELRRTHGSGASLDGGGGGGSAAAAPAAVQPSLDAPAESNGAAAPQAGAPPEPPAAAAPPTSSAIAPGVAGTAQMPFQAMVCFSNSPAVHSIAKHCAHAECRRFR